MQRARVIYAVARCAFLNMDCTQSLFQGLRRARVGYSALRCDGHGVKRKYSLLSTPDNFLLHSGPNEEETQRHRAWALPLQVRSCARQGTRITGKW